MSLPLNCACGARFEVEDTFAGQDVACPECHQTLKAPTLRPANRTTSDLAIASTILALVGAFTLIGTIAAVILGGLALVRISRNRDRLAGAGLAIFGVVAGLVFTVLMVLALGKAELFGLGAQIRRTQLGESVDTTGEMTVSNAAAGFRLTRTSRDWGVSTPDRLADPFVSLLQPAQGTNVLLVNTRRPVFVDVFWDNRGGVEPEPFLNEIIGDMASKKFNDDGPHLGRNRDLSHAKIISVKPVGETQPVPVDMDAKVCEREVTVRFNRQTWTMLIRVYLTPQHGIFVVRAYGERSHYARGLPDMRKVMDSFEIVNGQGPG